MNWIEECWNTFESASGGTYKDRFTTNDLKYLKGLTFSVGELVDKKTSNTRIVVIKTPTVTHRDNDGNVVLTHPCTRRIVSLHARGFDETAIELSDQIVKYVDSAKAYMPHSLVLPLFMPGDERGCISRHHFMTRFALVK